MIDDETQDSHPQRKKLQVSKRGEKMLEKTLFFWFAVGDINMNSLYFNVCTKEYAEINTYVCLHMG